MILGFDSEILAVVSLLLFFGVGSWGVIYYVIAKLVERKINRSD